MRVFIGYILSLSLRSVAVMHGNRLFQSEPVICVCRLYPQCTTVKWDNGECDKAQVLLSLFLVHARLITQGDRWEVANQNTAICPCSCLVASLLCLYWSITNMSLLSQMCHFGPTGSPFDMLTLCVWLAVQTELGLRHCLGWFAIKKKTVIN